jgi:hypothetical protein
MTTQPQLPFIADRVQAHRDSKRRQIEKYFAEHLGELVSSRAAHMKWGSAFRTRVSEINRDKLSQIFVNNEVKWAEGCEQSVYWGTRR